MNDWSPLSWQRRMDGVSRYPDAARLESALDKLRGLPPLVTSWEVERLKTLIAEAQVGKRFWLQGGDCAESLRDCTSEGISQKLKILLQMSLVITQAVKRPVIRVGRMAGQYAKPRSRATEARLDASGREVELPSYHGDLMNRWDFTPEARAFDPWHMVEGYQHAALTLNFIRSLVYGGFADPHHPENWELGPGAQGLPRALRDEYARARESLKGALELTAALDGGGAGDLTRVELFTSHEGLNLHYESAQTRTVPRREGHYNLTAHFPWIGDRTRQLDRAHVEYFRGIKNPVGVKLGPSATVDEVLALIEVLNPANEAGKLVLIPRLGARGVADHLPPLVDAVKREGRRVLWVCDPMHGNTRTAAGGVKTRSFEDVAAEVETAVDVHAAAGVPLGGIHFEMTYENVTECTGGTAGITDDDLPRNYATLCDPRLNYAQSIEIAFRVGEKLRAT